MVTNHVCGVCMLVCVRVWVCVLACVCVGVCVFLPCTGPRMANVMAEALLETMQRGSLEVRKAVAQALAANGFENLEDLQGAGDEVENWTFDKATLATSTGIAEYLPVHIAYLKAVIAKVNNKDDMQASRKVIMSANTNVQDQIILASRKCTVNISIGEGLKTASYADITPEMWPSSVATNELGADIAKQKEEGVSAPLPYQSMLKYAPNWKLDIYNDDDGKNASDSKAFMSERTWLAAATRWAQAAHCNQMLPMHVAMTHIDVCNRAAHEALLKGEAGNFGKNIMQTYDEIMRKKACENALRGLGMETIKVFTVLDRDVLEQAITLAKSRTIVHSKGKGKNKGGKDAPRWPSQKGQGKDKGSSDKSDKGKGQKRQWHDSWNKADSWNKQDNNWDSQKKQKRHD